MTSDLSLVSLPVRHREELARLEDGYWWYLGRIAWAKRLVAEYLGERGGRIDCYADVGCGTGGFARAMAGEIGAARVALVDAEPPPAFAANVVTLATDLEKDFRLDFSPRLITLMDVLEHIDDDVELLARLAAKLEPGGLVVLSVPAHQFLYSEWDRGLGHRRRYEPRELVDKITAAGLRVRRVRGMWSFLMPMGPWRKLTAKKQEALEFPKVSPLVNRALVLASRLEWLCSPLPAWFGTSLIVAAEKIEGKA